MERKTPIVLLIGRGSRVGPLIENSTSADCPYQITAVISHKKLDEVDGQRVDVPGIRKAKEVGIPTTYFNFLQMWKKAKGADSRLTEKSFKSAYGLVLGAYTHQRYPVSPEYVVLQGWDQILPSEFLDFYPSPLKGVHSIVNFHPALLPDRPLHNFMKTSKGVDVPVIRGDFHTVVNEGIRLKVPYLGLTANFISGYADAGGNIIKRQEIELLNSDTLKSYEDRLIPVEERFTVEVVDMLAQGRVRFGKTKVIVK